MVALARARSHFHLPQQSIHLGDTEHSPGPHRAVAGHGRQHQIEPFFEQQRRAVLREVVGNVADQGLDIALG